jgi:hypothetical protein
MENLDKMIETLGGYPIKYFTYNKRDNIFTGRVQDPICGRPELHDGYVTVCWRTNGKVEPRYGKGREDLEINVKLLR